MNKGLLTIFAWACFWSTLSMAKFFGNFPNSLNLHSTLQTQKGKVSYASRRYLPTHLLGTRSWTFMVVLQLQHHLSGLFDFARHLQVSQRATPLRSGFLHHFFSFSPHQLLDPWQFDGCFLFWSQLQSSFPICTIGSKSGRNLGGA